MNTLTMGRKKKELKPNEQLARNILEQYQSKLVADMKKALKDIFEPILVLKRKRDVSEIEEKVLYLFIC